MVDTNTHIYDLLTWIFGDVPFIPACSVDFSMAVWQGNDSIDAISPFIYFNGF